MEELRVRPDVLYWFESNKKRFDCKTDSHCLMRMKSILTLFRIVDYVCKHLEVD